MKGTFARSLRRAAGIAAGVLLLPAVSLAAHPATIQLRGYDNAPLAGSSAQPYSPKLTCSSQNGNALCHDYQKISNGYHFQQGRTNATGAITVSDAYSSVKPWVLSNGMFGKW